MRRYIWGRILRSILSIFLVVTLTIVMIYTNIPRKNVFKNDSNISKLVSRPDDYISYTYNIYDRLGYLDYMTQNDLCRLKAGEQYSSCVQKGSAVYAALQKEYEAKGYTFNLFTTGYGWCSRDFSPFETAWNFFAHLVQVDNPNYVQDEDNPNIERKVYFGTDSNGLPALKCSGCEHKYLIYLNGSFPFIHFNIITLHYGYSFPDYAGQAIEDVISDGQGEYKQSQVTFETGMTSYSAADLHSCRYKATSTLDTLDGKKFNDNYADCTNYFTDPSMVSTSYLFGILSLLLAYIIAVPAGVKMAQKKDKWQDKLGIVYVNIMIAVPSLAFIYFVKLIGNNLFQLPDKFPIYGFGDLRSYILPIVILALLSTSGTMIWLRRFMVDQASSDYVKFAKAKGLSQSEIFRRHILRNAIIPFVNSLPSNIILCISGAVITETVFSIPGMGKMLPDAIKASNNSVIVALTFLFTALSIFSLLLGDILITFVDPRIQLTSKGDSR